MNKLNNQERTVIAAMAAATVWAQRHPGRLPDDIVVTAEVAAARDHDRPGEREQYEQAFRQATAEDAERVRKRIMEQAQTDGASGGEAVACWQRQIGPRGALHLLLLHAEPVSREELRKLYVHAFSGGTLASIPPDECE